MTRLGKFFILAINFISVSTFAEQLKVIIDEPKELVVYHAKSLLFAARYPDGTLIGKGLFTVADLRAGVLEKPLDVDSSKEIVNCLCNWTVTSAVLPGSDPDPVVGEISMPLGFDGSIRNQCKVDRVNGEIKLSFEPYRLEKLEVKVPNNSFVTRKAVSLDATVTPKGQESDEYSAFSIMATDKTEPPFSKTHYLLAKEPLIYSLNTSWVLNDGEQVSENLEYKENIIEIK